MSQRETLSKPLVLASVGSANERVVGTELPPADFSTIEGVFPQYAGMQARMYGKRLLAKYADPIMGIAQFWTPLGYAMGLYQFEGTVDAGPWQTPISNIIIPTLPDSPGFDGGGMSLDDFGNSYGGPIAEPNICSIGFVGQNSAHQLCGTPLSNVGTPDDSNGGPAGQGKKCEWELGVAEDFVVPTIVGIQAGQKDQEVSTPSGPTPFPIYPSMPAVQPTAYTPGGGPFGAILQAAANSYSFKINLGGGNWVDHQGYNSQNTKAALSFVGIIDPDNPPAVAEFRVRHNPNGPFEYVYQPIVGLTVGPDGNYLTYPINVWDYVIPNYKQIPNPLGGGFTYTDFIVIEGIRLRYNTRVCA